MGFILPVPASESTNPAEDAKALIAHKDALEAELSSQFSILSTNASTMNSPLVDSDGFPRSDIDVYAVRHARVRIIELRNDLRGVMDGIAKALEGLHEQADETNEQAGSSRDEQTGSQPGDGGEAEPPVRPFARVDGVAPGSPAADAGLRREDLLVQFGTLTASSFSGSSLQPLAELVAEFENRPLPVKLLRENQTVELTFTPRRNWGGRGMLGCHIVPYNQ